MERKQQLGIGLLAILVTAATAFLIVGAGGAFAQNESNNTPATTEPAETAAEEGPQTPAGSPNENVTPGTADPSQEQDGSETTTVATEVPNTGTDDPVETQQPDKADLTTGTNDPSQEQDDTTTTTDAGTTTTTDVGEDGKAKQSSDGGADGKAKQDDGMDDGGDGKAKQGGDDGDGQAGDGGGDGAAGGNGKAKMN